MTRKSETLQDAVRAALRDKRIEPVKRVKDLYHVPRGRRNAPVAPRYIWHTYPIIGGICGTDLVLENVRASNALFRALTAKVAR